MSIPSSLHRRLCFLQSLLHQSLLFAERREIFLEVLGIAPPQEKVLAGLDLALEFDVGPVDVFIHIDHMVHGGEAGVQAIPGETHVVEAGETRSRPVRSSMAATSSESLTDILIVLNMVISLLDLW